MAMPVTLVLPLMAAAADGPPEQDDTCAQDIDGDEHGKERVERLPSCHTDPLVFEALRGSQP